MTGKAGGSGASDDNQVIHLVEESATVALEHASVLHAHLEAVDASNDSALRECQAEMHELVGDIVSLRNAAELLKRSLQDD